MSYYPPPHTGTSYPYSTYHPPATAYPQTPGAYPTTPYQTTAYPPTAVTGYGATWPYTYSYFPPQHASHSTYTAPKPAVPSAAANTIVTTPITSTTPRSAPTSTTYTFTPAYTRESVAAAASGGATGRGLRKQSTYKGLFTKERTSFLNEGWATIDLGNMYRLKYET